MIRVQDADGMIHEYDDGGAEGGGSFETEDVTNNLVIDVPEKYVVFADRKWVKVEQDRPGLED